MFEAEILEEQAALGTEFALRYKGVALIDNTLSANKRFYTEGFNNTAMRMTNEYMQSGGVVTVFSRHGNAVQVGQLPTGLPVGRLDGPLYREGPAIKYEALIASTSEGLDVARLIRSKVIKPSSVRFNQVGLEFEERILEGKRVSVPIKGMIKGIDLAEDAGIEGAGIEQVFEEAPTLELEDTMALNWSEVTLEGLEENCAQLLQEYANTVVEAYKAANPMPDVSAVAQLEEKAVQASQIIEEQTLKIAILESSLVGVGKAIRTVLTEKCHTLEEVEAQVEDVRKDVLQHVFESFTPQGKPKGIAASSQSEDDHTDGGDSSRGNDLTEEQQTILGFVQH